MATVCVNSFINSFTGIFAHISAGFIAITIAKKYGSHKVQLIVTGIALIAAALKEFWIDEVYEDPITRGSSPLDFAMYCTGIALGWII